MSHDWAWGYNQYTIHPHAGLFQVGDPVVLFVRDDKELSYRKAAAGERPDAIVTDAYPDHEMPGFEVVNAKSEGTLGSLRIGGVTGLDALPHQNQALWFRPSLGTYHGDRGNDGILFGAIVNPRYDFPLAANHLDLNRLTVITSETPPLGVLEMPRTGTHANDYVYLANEQDSGQTVKVTDLYPPKAGVREIAVSPGSTLFLRRNATNDGWLTDSSVTTIVTCAAYFNVHWLRDRWPWHGSMEKGRFLCAGMGNLRSGRATTARWGIPPTGAPVTVPANDRTYLELPDAPELGLGLLVEINSEEDGSGDIIGSALIREGDDAIELPATAKSATTKYLSLSASRRNGKLAVKLAYTTSDTSNWGSDAYLRAYEPVIR